MTARLRWPAAIVAAVAGIALVFAPLFDAAGSDGVAPDLRGSFFDLKPDYGAVLALAGVSITVGALGAAWYKRPAIALAGAAIAIVVGLSLELVTYEIDDVAFSRSWDMLDLRGWAAWQAGIAAAVALVASLALAASTIRDAAK
jgi:hypothetical protein